jgi:hypothetical protein
MKKRSVGAAVGLTAMALGAHAGGVRTLILSSTSTPSWVTDIRNKILANAQEPMVVDTFDLSAGTPTLNQLKTYDSVLVVTDAAPADRAALGNVLADFVDAGGGVVQTMFSVDPGSIGIDGRWKTGNYSPLTFTSQTGGAATIGTRPVSSHPVLQGVTTFNGGFSSFRAPSTPTAGAHVIANWSDNIPLVVTKGKVVALNMYPVSSDVRSDFWSASTDGGRMLANAVSWASQVPVKVLVASAAADGAAWTEDVRQQLIRAGRVGADVDVFNISTGTPTLAQLKQYDAVMVLTDLSPANPAAFGNALADYVDAGGGVVVTAFYSHAAGMAGRFASAPYAPFAGSSFTLGGPQSLGTRLIPDHPLLAGVGAVNGGTSSFRLRGTLNAGWVRVANWTSGEPMVATNSRLAGRIAMVGMFPVSNAQRGDLWDQNTDGGALLGNALRWSKRQANDVMLLGDYNDGLGPDVPVKIRNSGRIGGRVDEFNGTTGVPSLSQLRRYDSVMVWTDFAPADPNTMGDVLAAYVDSGGGVVHMLGSDTNFFSVGGRWRAESYGAFTPGSLAVAGNLGIGARAQPNHPLLASVEGFDLGQSSYHTQVGLTSGSSLIASWTNGEVAAAERSVRGTGRVLGLNMFPGSSDVISGGWVSSTPGARLMTNALNHVARSDMDVLVVGSPGGIDGSGDIRNKVVATGRVTGRIDIANAQTSTPSQGLLEAYSAVAFWTNVGPFDPITVGNTLANYNDVAGGVVTLVGASTGLLGPTGRWLSEEYNPLLPLGAPNYIPNLTLGATLLPGHPLMAGVDAFNIGSLGAFDAVNERPGAKRVVNYSNGVVLAAERQRGIKPVVGLNFFAPSSTVFANGWLASTDGGILITNALTRVKDRLPCPADFNEDGFLDFFDFDDFVACFESGVCPPGRSGDYDGDGFGDFFDFAAFVSDFENGC